jgi:hypothetical protein
VTESVRHHDDGFQAQTDPVQAMVRAHAPGTDRLVAGGLGSGGDFSDFSHEWRRLFSRLLGTFLLVLVAAGASVIQDRSTGQIGRIAKVAAPALTVLTVNLFMSAVSGAHLNPIVSVTFALGHDFRWRRVPGCILAQLLGALLAALLLRATSATSPTPGPPCRDRGSARPRPSSSKWCSLDRLIAFTGRQPAVAQPSTN